MNCIFFVLSQDVSEKAPKKDNERTLGKSPKNAPTTRRRSNVVQMYAIYAMALFSSSILYWFQVPASVPPCIGSRFQF